jgi:hypothetical protein
MKKIIMLTTSLLFFILPGCLWYQIIEYTVHFKDDFNSGSVIIKYSNVMSDSKDTSKVREDFEQLIKMVTGDGYLLDGMESGLYVQDRKLVEEDGQLNAYEKGIFRQLAIDDEKSTIQNDERIITLSNKDKAKIECNGKIIKLENNTILVWPKEQRDLYIKVTSTKEDTLSSLLPYYRQWKGTSGR